MGEIETEHKKVNQGRNVKFAREHIHRLSQEDLALKLNISSSKLSRIEKEEAIDEELLKNISTALEVPLDFFKNTDLDDLLQTVINNATQNSAQDSHDSFFQGKENKVNYTLSGKLAKEFMVMQREHYEKEMATQKENHEKELVNAKYIGTLEEKVKNLELEKEIALLKQQMELSKK